jgi:hypothetical protein
MTVASKTPQSSDHLASGGSDDLQQIVPMTGLKPVASPASSRAVELSDEDYWSIIRDRATD